MKYETPELNALVAIDAIQNSINSKSLLKTIDVQFPGNPRNEVSNGYADWE